jgi:zinc transporter 1/2/3
MKGSLIAGIMLLITLDIHSVIAGITAGLNIHDFGILFAIALHKTVAAFALGSTLVNASVTRFRYVIFCATFCVSTPVGIMVGVGLEGDIDPEGATLGVMYAVVGGTFMYISILEIGIKELLVCRMEPHGHGVHRVSELGKLGALVFGFALMAVLAIWI